MRQKRSRLKTYSHRKAIPKKDSEGSSYVEYGIPSEFEAEMWAAGTKQQSELYGVRLPMIRNLRIRGEYKEISSIAGVLAYELEDGLVMTVGDGICLNVPPESEPDYKIVAIYPNRLLALEVEKSDGRRGTGC